MADDFEFVDDKITTIHWVRHAESCSNVDKSLLQTNSSKISDETLDETLDEILAKKLAKKSIETSEQLLNVSTLDSNETLDEIFAKTSSKTSSKTSADTSSKTSSKTSADTLAGSDKEIIPFFPSNKSSADTSAKSFGQNFFSTISKGFETIGQKVGAFKDVAVQKISQPPLSEYGLLQACNLGIKIDENYNAIFCSPSTRTIMTIMLALETKYRNIDRPNKKVIITDNIIENQNIAGAVGADYQNKAVNQENLTSIIYFLREWLNNNYFLYFPLSDFNLVTLHGELLNYIDSTLEPMILSNIDFLDKNFLKKKFQLLKLLIKENNSLLNDEIGEAKINILNNIIEKINDLIIEFERIRNNNVNSPIQAIHIQKLNELLSKLRYYQKTDRFDFIKFRFEKDIHKTKTSNLEILIRTKKSVRNNMEYFMHYALNKYPNGKILCITHGSFLRATFGPELTKFNNHNIEITLRELDQKINQPNITLLEKDKLEKEKIKTRKHIVTKDSENEIDNTQILIQNLDSKDIASFTRVHKNTDQEIIPKHAFINAKKANNQKYDNDNMCKSSLESNDENMFSIIHRMAVYGRDSRLDNSQLNRKFKIGSNNFTKQTPIFQQHPDEFVDVNEAGVAEEVGIDEDGDNKYFQKYLKYKQKYLELRKNKTI